MLSPSDPQRDAARAKREHRRERDREHYRDSRGGSGGGGKSSNTRRNDRESSVPHSEQEYAISTKQQQQHRQGQNRSRERPRQQRSQENERPLSHHEQMTATDLNLEPCKFLFSENVSVSRKKLCSKKSNEIFLEVKFQFLRNFLNVLKLINRIIYLFF